MSKNNKLYHNMSVDDIIKSIRNIIDNHNTTTSEQATNESKDEDEVLELTNVFDITKEVTQTASNTSLKKDDNDYLVSPQSAEQTATTFKQFANTAKSTVTTAGSTKITTLEEIVKDMIRPQLKKWLDDNLPILVKQLVEKEIKRLIPEHKE